MSSNFLPRRKRKMPPVAPPPPEEIEPVPKPKKPAPFNLGNQMRKKNKRLKQMV
jgi:hypothetical protein